jgi:hypothetical protein
LAPLRLAQPRLAQTLARISGKLRGGDSGMGF